MNFQFHFVNTEQTVLQIYIYENLVEKEEEYEKKSICSSVLVSVYTRVHEFGLYGVCLVVVVVSVRVMQLTTHITINNNNNTNMRNAHITCLYIDP